MRQAELTAEAREAIRAFVSQLIIPSGFVLVLFSAVAGFIVKDWAVSEANKELEPKIQAQIDSAQAKLTAALHDADTKLTELYNTRDKIQASNVALEVSASNLKTDLDAISRSIPIIGSLSPAQVLQLNDLLQKVATNSVSNASASKGTDSGRSNWDSFIQALSKTEVTTAVGTGSSSRCPVGSYAVGFDLLTSPGGSHGIVYGGSIVCQAFPRD